MFINASNVYAMQNQFDNATTFLFLNQTENKLKLKLTKRKKSRKLRIMFFLVSRVPFAVNVTQKLRYILYTSRNSKLEQRMTVLEKLH